MNSTPIHPGILVISPSEPYAFILSVGHRHASYGNSRVPDHLPAAAAPL